MGLVTLLQNHKCVLYLAVNKIDLEVGLDCHLYPTPLHWAPNQVKHLRQGNPVVVYLLRGGVGEGGLSPALVPPYRDVLGLVVRLKGPLFQLCLTLWT